jgi:hypothetical protein
MHLHYPVAPIAGQADASARSARLVPVMLMSVKLDADWKLMPISRGRRLFRRRGRWVFARSCGLAGAGRGASRAPAWPGGAGGRRVPGCIRTCGPGCWVIAPPLHWSLAARKVTPAWGERPPTQGGSKPKLTNRHSNLGTLAKEALCTEGVIMTLPPCSEARPYLFYLAVGVIHEDAKDSACEYHELSWSDTAS